MANKQNSVFRAPSLFDKLFNKASYNEAALKQCMAYLNEKFAEHFNDKSGAFLVIEENQERGNRTLTLSINYHRTDDLSNQIARYTFLSGPISPSGGQGEEIRSAITELVYYHMGIGETRSNVLLKVDDNTKPTELYERLIRIENAVVTKNSSITDGLDRVQRLCSGEEISDTARFLQERLEEGAREPDKFRDRLAAERIEAERTSTLCGVAGIL